MEEKNEKKDNELVYPEGGYGWVIVFAIILLNISLLTLIYCFGIIFRDEFNDMGITAAKTSFLLHLQISLFCVVGFFGSPLLKRYSYRKVACAGATIWCSGIFLTSFANSYALLIVTISIMTGVGQGILMPATYLATNSYFKKRLTLAVSISTTGASIFSIFSPKLCHLLVTNLGRKYTVLTLFSISLLSFIGCFLLKPLPPAQKSEEDLVKLNHLNQQATPDNETSVQTYSETTRPKPKTETVISKLINLFDLSLLKQLSYSVAVLALSVSYAAELNVIVMLQFILPELAQFDGNDVANVTSVQFVFDIIGRLVIPMVCHYFNASPKWIYIGALIAASVARTLLAWYYQYYTVVYVAVCIFGVTKGLRAVYQSVIVPKLVPLDKYATANGFQMFFTGAISLVIGPVIGIIHDTWKSYVPALHTASILSCCCVVLWVNETIFNRKKPDRTES
ncbi:unnamed protein product [Phyllotreta striolata]|uniref:Uncharacterized protein n=1 Tax=Phyllotreta striolata TaxID=444603 RepID=A0A9N9TEA3_PHYSR|nr:unnamed protein product [Phyllotreta striolata]